MFGGSIMEFILLGKLVKYIEKKKDLYTVSIDLKN